MDPHRPSYHNEEEEYDEGLDDSAEQLGKRPLEGLDDSAEQQKRPLDHESSCQVGVGGDKIGVGVGGEKEFEDHGPSEQEGMKGEEDQSDESGYKDNASESRAFEEDRTSQKRKSLAPMGGTDSVRRKTNARTSSASAAKDTIIIEEEDDESRAGRHRTSVSGVQKMNLLGPVWGELGPGWLASRRAPFIKKLSSASEPIQISDDKEEEVHDEGLDVSAEQQKHPLDHNNGSPQSDTSGDRTNCQVGVGGEE